jgi:hypothetical protein
MGWLVYLILVSRGRFTMYIRMFSAVGGWDCKQMC